jgi:hypothetical protein
LVSSCHSICGQHHSFVMTSSLARFSQPSFGNHLVQVPEAELQEAALVVSLMMMLLGNQVGLYFEGRASCCYWMM